MSTSSTEFALSTYVGSEGSMCSSLCDSKLSESVSCFSESLSDESSSENVPHGFDLPKLPVFDDVSVRHPES